MTPYYDEDGITIYRQPKIRVYCRRCNWSGMRLDWWPSRRLTEEKPCPRCDGQVKVK